MDSLVPLAKKANVDFIWVHGASTVLESTLAYSLNSTGTPCLVVEMGVGMRITREYGDQLTDGIFHLMEKLGIWAGKTKEPRVQGYQQAVYKNFQQHKVLIFSIMKNL